MRIGIYGGTFNPPHLGHLTAARTAFELLKLDKLYLIPAAVPPHKPLPPGSPDAAERLELTRLAGEQLGLGDRVETLERTYAVPADVAVLEGFRDQEAADRRYYQAMLRLAPAAARPALRELMARKQAHSRYLGALLYLITGQSRPETLDCQRIYVGNWCPALRQRYHEEACAGFNYLRAADGTADPCLQKAYQRLSEESYQQAEWVTGLLEKALGPSCTRPGMGV